MLKKKGSQSPILWDPKGSLPHLQQPTSCPYSEPNESGPRPTIPLTKDPSYYYPPIFTWVFQVVYFPQVSPPKPCIHSLSPLCATCPHSTHFSRFDHPNDVWWGVL